MKINKIFKQLILWVGLLLMYVPTICWMWDRWFVRDSYYSHGVLIPFVSLFLVWQKKKQLSALEHKSSPIGFPLIIIGVFIHAVSSLARVYFTSGFSMILVVIGLILYLYGSKVLKEVIFPVFFLLFMVPAPLIIITTISFKMKIFAAEIAERILNGMGIVALREGSLIKMRSTYVLVDDVCSGLRSLISLMALGSIFAFWMKNKMFKRILLFISTIPIAIITNVFRIVFLSIVSEVWGAQYASGFLHDLSGFLVFGLAFILLFAMGRILE
ncbi:exosortase/archaeosortase family protein [Candidatus Omnitrophota bacterium]